MYGTEMVLKSQALKIFSSTYVRDTYAYTQLTVMLLSAPAPICKDIKGAQLYVNCCCVEETSKNRAKWARIIIGIFLLCNIKGYKFSVSVPTENIFDDILQLIVCVL